MPIQHVADLKANPGNPRKISPEKLAMLKKAIAEFGDLSGIIFNRKTGQLVGGHQRTKLIDAKTPIKIDKTYPKPTKTGTVAEGSIIIAGERHSYREVSWDETREKAANIAANKGAGNWDTDALGEWMKEIEDFGMDIDLTMFDRADRIDFGFEGAGSAMPDPRDDVVPEAPKVAKSKLGDIYLLGRHRLMCGDSTSVDAIGKLMNGVKAEITFTSPPYNLGRNAKLRGYNGDGEDSVYTEKSDYKTQEQYLDFLISFTNNALNFSKLVFCNVQLLAGNKLAIPKYWAKYEDQLVDLMVWDKEHATPQMEPRVLNSVFEFVFILADEHQPKRSIKTGKEWRGTLQNVFRLNPLRGVKDESSKTHGATFPVAFAEHFLGNFSEKTCLDPFGGSGSTMIAAEKLGRACFMMELDPGYCDVIVKRWEDYTGEKAVLQSAKHVKSKNA